MALINCPECGIEVSSLAVSCPKCGCPIKVDTTVKINTDIKGSSVIRNWAGVQYKVFAGHDIKIIDRSTNNVLWHGKCGDIASFDIDTKTTKIDIVMKVLDNLLYDLTIEQGKKYQIAYVPIPNGIFGMKANYKLIEVDNIDSE